MPLRIYNTASRKLEIFSPATDKSVSLYTCGPTVYDYPHIGNWASFIYWDTLVRVLKFSGYNVTRVMNLTDVGHLVSDADDGEDKLEKGARREGKSAWEIADFYIADFKSGMKSLNLIQPEYLARATDYIPQQLELIRQLKAGGYTYQISDGIYFDTSKFSRYSDFARLDLKSQKAGARVKLNTEKHRPWDFALWKFTEPGKKRDMEWETPIDILAIKPEQYSNPIMGFPGWHLECSAIAMSLLGKTIDIHTGGIDHIPIHHTNEIAQSESATKQPFAHYWLHNNHLKINNSKVSKSLGNGYTLQDIESHGFSPMDLRMFILQSQYTSEGNFTFDNLVAAKNRLNNWQNYAALRHQIHDRLTDDASKTDLEKFVVSTATIGAIRDALWQNLNTPKALSIIDDALSGLEEVDLDTISWSSLNQLLEAADELLGLQLLSSTPDIDDEAKQLIIRRERAREAKDWPQSDTLRDQLLKMNVVVKDTSHGPVWSRQ
ncbi:MAG: cysteine--tRNA ligase [Candidatus Saccharimonas sp.]